MGSKPVDFPYRLPNLALSLPSLLSPANSQISHLNRLLSTTSNLNTTLCTLTYILHLLRVFSSRLATLQSSFATHILLRKSSTGKSTLFFAEKTLVATVFSIPSLRLLRLTQTLTNATKLIDDFRIFLRLWGLLEIWSWGTLILLNPPKDNTLKGIRWTQIIACAMYQFFENKAYLASKGILVQGKGKVGKWYSWSSRFWMVHVLLDLASLARVRNLQQLAQENLKKEQSLVRIGSEDYDPAVESVDIQARSKEEEIWWREFYINLAWTPLTVHWSMENGFLSEAQIALLGVIAGGVRLREAWNATA